MIPYRLSRVACLDSAPVTFSFTVMPCVDGGCSGNGQCREYSYNIFHYTSCSCVASKYLKLDRGLKGKISRTIIKQILCKQGRPLFIDIVSQTLQTLDFQNSL